jgi:hypothetical protein
VAGFMLEDFSCPIRLTVFSLAPICGAFLLPLLLRCARRLADCSLGDFTARLARLGVWR